MTCVNLVLALAVTVPSLGAQRGGRTDPGAERVRTAARTFRGANEAAIVRELADLLRIPNVASDSANIRRNAEQLLAMLRRRNVDARLLEAGGSPPAVYGELRVPGATRTVVLYAHYDGQPVDPSQWSSPPFSPVLRSAPVERGGREVALPAAGRVDPEARFYARSASDDKAPIVAMLAALDALREARIAPSVNIKFFFEGEEEAGSPHLRAMLERHAELLRADAWLFCDGPVHASRKAQVVFGVRGVMGLEMTIYGPERALHSGHYGNWAPNPIAMLTGLLASMRDADGRILIAGFGDDVQPLGASERAALAVAPAPDSALRVALGLAHTEGGGALLAETIMRPALNLRGIRGGAVGALAPNAVPAEASASIDFRLVPAQQPSRVRALVEEHIRGRGYTIVRQPPDSATRRSAGPIALLEWDEGYPATRTSMELPVSRAVLRVLDATAGAPVIRVPTLGGSLPMHLFGEILDAPLIVVPIVNHDNNQHAANENLRIQNLWDGIELFAALIARLGPAWESEAARP